MVPTDNGKPVFFKLFSRVFPIFPYCIYQDNFPSVIDSADVFLMYVSDVSNLRTSILWWLEKCSRSLICWTDGEGGGGLHITHVLCKIF